MKGVQYFFDEDGEPKAVLIDLKKNAALWEDIVVLKRGYAKVRFRSRSKT
jgi:hypothetical protein